jgi:hypothetical protein
VVTFSNLGQGILGKFATSPYDAIVVAGKSALPDTETWCAVSFVPKSDVQVKVLSAAIEYLSGTKLVNLGIYSDNGGDTVGTLLPGGQGSTSEIPNSGDCCQMAKVTLTGAGVTLKAQTQYWLVASPDNVNGPTFDGRWQLTTRSTYDQYAYGGWGAHLGPWPAAQILSTQSGKISEKTTQQSSESSSRPSNIPTFDVCCELAKINLPGVALSAGVQYWLVVSPDDVHAPTFEGVWQISYRAQVATQEPELPINWTTSPGYWLAAEIKGISP